MKIHIVCDQSKRDITDSHLALIPSPTNGAWKADKNMMHSYAWRFGVENKEKLIGSELYLHDKKSEDSYIGGVIVDYFQDAGQPLKNRVVLVFETDNDFSGVKTNPKAGWNQHMKVIND